MKRRANACILQGGKDIRFSKVSTMIRDVLGENLIKLVIPLCVIRLDKTETTQRPYVN